MGNSCQCDISFLKKQEACFQMGGHQPSVIIQELVLAPNYVVAHTTQRKMGQRSCQTLGAVPNEQLGISVEGSSDLNEKKAPRSKEKHKKLLKKKTEYGILENITKIEDKELGKDDLKMVCKFFAQHFFFGGVTLEHMYLLILFNFEAVGCLALGCINEICDLDGID